MSSHPEKQARAEAMLGELAEISLMVAKELAVRLRESEDADQAVALAGAFQKVSRVVRLTLALDFKLERDAARDEREARKAEAEAEARAPVGRREDPVRDRLDRILWAESEGDHEEFDRLWEDLDERIYEATDKPEFKDTPVEVVIEHVLADMGLTGAFTPTVGEPPPAEAVAHQPQLADTG